MVITKLSGGLGNQMFQYAIGRAVQLKHNTALKADLTWFNETETKSHEKPQLNIFPNINLKTADRNELFVFKRKTVFGSKHFFNIIRCIKKYSKLLEPSFEFDPTILLNTSKNCYLSGYWQSEKYFLHIRDTLLYDFSFPKNNSNQNKKIIDQIRVRNSISVHIRRGDYISDPTNSKNHGFIGVKYYQKALDFLVKKIEDPIIVIFSDDINWVMNNLVVNTPKIFVDWNTGDNSIFDMYLMSLCKHNIIANSSFSWWAAWLNQNPQKIVIAPGRWFNERDWNISDLIPETWIKI